MLKKMQTNVQIDLDDMKNMHRNMQKSMSKNLQKQFKKISIICKNICRIPKKYAKYANHWIENPICIICTHQSFGYEAWSSAT
jgi:hypothetical protein